MKILSSKTNKKNGKSRVRVRVNRRTEEQDFASPLANIVDSRYLDFDSRITAYLEEKVWFLFKHRNLTSNKKYCG